jgi:hypothetical protein
MRVTSRGVAPEARRVLMLTPHWPPSASAGVRRPMRIARHLGRHGWTPVVMTPASDALPTYRPRPRDPTLRAPEVDLHRVAAPFLGAAAWRGLGRALRAVLGSPLGDRVAQAVGSRMLFLPDPTLEWLPAVLASLPRVGRIDVVWATGAPWSIHIIGAAAAARLGVPLVLDYRDPWTTHEVPMRLPYRPREKAMRQIEAALLRRADAVAYVNEDMLARNRAVFDQPARAEWRAIPNGFDAADFPDTPAVHNERPTLLYAGSCYAGRSLDPILEAMSGRAAGPEALAFKVFGELDTASQARLARTPMPDCVTVCPRLPNTGIVAEMRGAAALLLVIGPHHKTALSSKIFDYALAGRPVLGYGPADSDAARLVRAAGLGAWVDAGDEAGLHAALDTVERGDLRADVRWPVLEPYSAAVMARCTAELLESVVARRPPRR